MKNLLYSSVLFSEIMKACKTIFFGMLFWISITTGIAQTPITDANFHDAIYECLSTNPVDGLCYSCQYGAMPDWDVSAVTEMSGAFADKINFNADISNWDVSNVTDMSTMFVDAWRFSQDIGSWDVGSVTNFWYMFGYTADFDQDIGSWDVRNATDMSRMFYYAAFNQDISDWCVEQIPSEPSDFSYGCPLLPEFQPYWGEPCDPTGIYDDSQGLDIQIFPNPTDEKITIELPTCSPNIISTVIIYGMGGREVVRLQVQGTRSEINVSSLPGGIYGFRVSNCEGTWCGRFIKK